MKILMINKNTTLLFLLLVGVFIQIPVLSLSNSSSSVKLFHFIIPILSLFLLFRLKIILLKNDVLLFFLLLLISGLFNGLIYGFNILIVQALYCILTYYVALNIAYYMKLDDYKKTIKIIAKIFIIAVILKSFLFFHELSIVYTTHQASLSIPFWFVAGGHNLEITYMAFLTLFFIKRTFIFYLLLSILIFFSLIYLSRIGMIECVILLFFRFIYNLPKRLILLYSFFFFVLLTMIVLIIYANNEKFLDRFFNIANELKDTKSGRGMLWSSAFMLTENNLSGYGIGNSILMAKTLLSKNFIENNFHNVYVQYLLDTGIVPLITYLYLLIKRAVSSKIKEFQIFFIVFAIVSFVQFTGYDVVFWLFLGLYDAFSRKLYLQNKKEIFNEHHTN